MCKAWDCLLALRTAHNLHGVVRKQGTGKAWQVPSTWKLPSVLQASGRTQCLSQDIFVNPSKQTLTWVTMQSMAIEDARDEDTVDLVTEIQRKLGNLLGLMYSCTGAIQVHGFRAIFSLSQITSRFCLKLEPDILATCHAA